jgi:hypothetical protein
MTLANAFASAGLVSKDKATEVIESHKKEKTFQKTLQEYHFRCKPIQEFLCEYEHTAENGKQLNENQTKILLALRNFYFDFGESHLQRNIDFHLDRIFKKQSWKKPTEKQKLIWAIRACGYTLLDVLSDTDPRHYSDSVRRNVMAWIDSQSDKLGI